MTNLHHLTGRGRRRSNVLTALNVEAARHSELINTHHWVIDDRFCIFGGNFEETLRKSFGETYTALEDEARDEYSLSGEASKPFVARYAANHLQLDAYPTVKERVTTLADKISALDMEVPQV